MQYVQPLQVPLNIMWFLITEVFHWSTEATYIIQVTAFAFVVWCGALLCNTN